MHISMEETVAENLSEEHLHATFCQQFHVSALLVKHGNVRNGNAVDALHHHHVLTTIVREHFRHIQHWAVFKIPTQLDSIRRFT
ncbi:hypothetical protein D3C75_1152060 [compost metagenome]